jgi:hypothetical protein
MDSCDALKVWKRMDCIACWAAVWCFVALARFLVRYERAAGTARGRLAAPRGAARLVDGRAGVIVRDCRARQRDTVICVCFTPTRVPCRRSMIGPVAVWPYVCVSSAVTPYVTRYPGRMCICMACARATPPPPMPRPPPGYDKRRFPVGLPRPYGASRPQWAMQRNHE